MRRWILKAGATDLDGLVLEDVPMPEPGPGEVQIRVHPVSLNYRDRLVLKGQFANNLSARDLIPISDGAGEIDAIGAGVTTWAVGDRVTGLLLNWLRGAPTETSFGLGSLSEDGMLAEYVMLPADRVVRAPASLDDAEAATLPCAALTAWNAIHGGYPIGKESLSLVDITLHKNVQ